MFFGIACPTFFLFLAGKPETKLISLNFVGESMMLDVSRHAKRHATPARYKQEEQCCNRRGGGARLQFSLRRDALTKPDDFCGGNADQRDHLTFQILTRVGTVVT